MQAASNNRPNRRFRATKRVCQFCVEKTEIDYKQVDLLNRYVRESARARPPRQPGPSANPHPPPPRENKRARHIALLPFVSD